MLNCVEATRLLSDKLERKLGVKERIDLKIHTMMCNGCRNFGDQMYTLRDIVRAYANGKDEDVSSDDTK